MFTGLVYVSGWIGIFAGLVYFSGWIGMFTGGTG